MHEYYMLYKPRGYISAMADPVHRTLAELVPPQITTKLHPVGRLDKDTEGLLLLTDDGMLDNHLLRPEHHVMKTYLFMAFGTMTDEDAARMSAGVTLYGSGFHTAPADCAVTGHSDIGHCEAYLPADRREHYMKNPSRPVSMGTVRIREGHKHQVRLMVKAAGGHVFYLKRTHIGPLALDAAMRPGDLRPLTADELHMLNYPPAIG